MLFTDRHEAGVKLAEALKQYTDLDDTIVLALPRGGVVIAYEVAQALHIPLDIFLVRKLGVPGQEELAFGAIASGGVSQMNEEIVRLSKLSQTDIDRVVAKEQAELSRREKVYRQGKPLLDLMDKTVILVDDGIATGATLMAAIAGLRQICSLKQCIVAVPVVPASTVSHLTKQVDEMICLHVADDFVCIGQYYLNFSQVDDAEVLRLLHR